MGRLQVLPYLPGITSRFRLYPHVVSRKVAVAKNSLLSCLFQVGANGWESFQLLIDGRPSGAWWRFIELVKVMSRILCRWEQCVGPQA